MTSLSSRVLDPFFGSFSPIHIKFSFVGVSGVTCSALVSIPSITSPPTPPRPKPRPLHYYLKRDVGWMEGIGRGRVAFCSL